jgi:tRNA(Ile)-lysidine synthase
MFSSLLYNTLVDYFRSFLKKDLSVLIGVSGGCDSVALAYLLREFAEQLGIKRIAIAHVNHGLRGGESDGDEQLVHHLANSLDCEIFCKRLCDLSLNSFGLEETARKERYAFFHSLKKEHNFDFIATAHTADDQAETVLHRLIRGTGLSGLRSIHAKRDDGVIRPLLSITKKDLIDWLNHKGYKFRVDSSNSDTHFRRNFLRHKVIPPILEMDPSAILKIASIACDADRIWTLLQESVMFWITQNLITDTSKSFELKKSGFENKALASEALHQIFQKKKIETSKKHISTLLSNVHRTFGQFLLPQGWSYFPLRERILFLKDTFIDNEVSYHLKNPGVTEINERKIRIVITEPEVASEEKSSSSAFLDKYKCGDSLIFRTISPNDYFVPLGKKSSVSALSFLSKQGFTKIERDRMGVVVDSHNKLLWILGIRINDECKITESTSKTIKISFQILCDIV